MFFATLSFFAFIFAFFLIPETSGIPLEQVYRLFKIKPIWKADKILKEQLKQEEQQFRSDVKGEVSQSENLEDVSDKRGEV
ncbi:Putative quinate permease [Fusarium odoratissimum]|nr:Putative quinate permease [Fusarium odoratissimum]